MQIENKVVYEYIEQYIRTVQPSLDSDVETIRQEAEVNNVPIVKPEVASLISTILALKKPNNILEIGTAVGFSAILMSRYANEITTIERDQRMYDKACQNIANMKLDSKIKIIFGDATEELGKLSDKYDVIFIDAAKGQYDTFYNYAIKLLADDGLIIADNVLYKGLVALEKEDVIKRNRTIHKRMREFIQMIMTNKEFESTLIPVGDGIVISKKK